MPRKKKSKAGRPRKHYLDVRIPANFSLPQKTVVEFKRKCKEYGVSHNDVLTELLNEFNTS